MCHPLSQTDPRPKQATHSEELPGPIAIVKTGRTYPKLACRCGDFEDWTARGLGLAPEAVKILDVEADSRLPPPGDLAGAVVTGSHSMVTEGQVWVEPLAEWLKGLVQAEVPILGVCFGHQLLGHALGGRVGVHPDGPEIGTVEVTLLPESQDDPLLGEMPKRFHAHATHTQSVLTLPVDAVLLARTDHEAHAAFRVGSCAWGVQFHPEYDEGIMRYYVREQRAVLEGLGRDAGRVEDGIRNAGAGQILSRFVDLARRPQLGNPDTLDQ